jgi:hypothetical protein
VTFNFFEFQISQAMLDVEGHVQVQLLSATQLWDLRILLLEIGPRVSEDLDVSLAAIVVPHRFQECPTHCLRKVSIFVQISEKAYPNV